MNKWILRATLFFSFGAILNLESADLKTSCEKNIQVTEARIKKSLELHWQEVDSSVGVEFFLVVLKGNDRMPASDTHSSAEFYSKLFSGIKKTSRELSDQGLLLDIKKVKQTEDLISELEKAEKCLELVSNN